MCEKCGENKPCYCKLTNDKKWLYTLYTTIIFILVANPYAYKLVNSIVGNVSIKKVAQLWLDLFYTQLYLL